MREIGAFEAKTHLAELLAAAEAGERVTITRRGQPVAQLGPVATASAGSDRSAALRRLVDLRRRLSGLAGQGMSAAEILSARDQGRR